MEVLQRNTGGFTHRFQSGKMDYRVYLMSTKNHIEFVLIKQVDFIECKAFSCQLLYTVQRFFITVTKVVYDDNIISVFKKLNTGMAANITCTACNQDIHR